MARVEKKRKAEAAPRTAMEMFLREHLTALQVRGYSEYTIRGRKVAITFFIDWAYDHGLSEPIEVTRPVLERYQRHLFFYRKKNGEPLTFRSQHGYLIPLRVWFRWLTRQNHILHNPASEIELPRLGRSLPKNILSLEEVERVMAQPDIAEPIGLRDRAILELLYATGLRRLEVIRLKLFDLQLDRGLILVNQGKGRKDRYVPIGERAAAWLRKYIAEARPQLAIEPDDFTAFLTADGEPFSRDHLTWTVRQHMIASKTGKPGACHLLRHCMATHMHENGADIRHIHIQGREVLQQPLSKRAHRLRALHIQLHCMHAGVRLDGVLERALPPPRDDDRVALLCQRLRQPAANAGAATGNQNRVACQLHPCSSPVCLARPALQGMPHLAQSFGRPPAAGQRRRAAPSRSGPSHPRDSLIWRRRAQVVSTRIAHARAFSNYCTLYPTVDRCSGL